MPKLDFCQMCRVYDPEMGVHRHAVGCQLGRVSDSRDWYRQRLEAIHRYAIDTPSVPAEIFNIIANGKPRP